MADTSALLAKAKALVDTVDFDNNGTIVAGRRVGGNGGLYSLATIKAADELRRVIDTVEQQDDVER